MFRKKEVWGIVIVFILAAAFGISYNFDKDVNEIKNDEIVRQGPIARNIPLMITWEQYYGDTDDERAKDIEQTADGGYILLGDTEYFDGSDAYIYKIDRFGNQEWHTQLYPGDDGSLYAFDIDQTRSGEFIISGSSGNNNVRLIKLDKQGDVIFDKDYSTAVRRAAVVEAHDSGYIIAAQNENFGTYVVTVFKVDEQGNLIWETTNDDDGSNLNQYPYDIERSSDGGYVFLYSRSPPPGYIRDSYVMKIDSQGNEVWDIGVGVGAHQKLLGYNILEDRYDGGYVAVGYGYYGQDYNPNVYLFKVRPDGSVEWVKDFDFGYEDYGTSIDQAIDGNYVIAGQVRATQNSVGDILVLKVDRDGNLIWSKEYDDGYGEYGKAIAATNDGGMIVNAQKYPGQGPANNDFYVLKLNQDGNL